MLGSTSGAGVPLQFGLVDGQGVAWAAVLTPNANTNVRNVYFAKFFTVFCSLGPSCQIPHQSEMRPVNVEKVDLTLKTAIYN
jgi:hypothetical protein